MKHNLEEKTPQPQNIQSAGRIYCKTKLFPPLYVGLELPSGEADSNAFKHSKKKRVGNGKKDLTQVETLRWLQRHSLRFRTGNYDISDEFPRDEANKDREMKHAENKFLCFTGRITLSEREGSPLRRTKTSYKERGKNKNRNNLSCDCRGQELERKTEKQLSQFFLTRMRFHNCECCMRRSGNNLFENTSENARTIFNNLYLKPKTVNSVLGVKGNGYGDQYKEDENDHRIQRSSLSLPKIKTGRIQATSRKIIPDENVRFCILGKERERTTIATKS